MTDANEPGVLVRRESHTLSVTFNRPAARNSIDHSTLTACHRALDSVVADEQCRALVFRGAPGVFCTGLDFAAAAGGPPAEWDDERFGYAALLRRLTQVPVVVFSLVDGAALAGGVGIAAASDVVLVTPRASFRLTEVMWGLQPANVTPYLIRRVGFQRAYRMALTTMPVSAEEAVAACLADALDPVLDDALRRHMLPIRRIDRDAIRESKRLFAEQWLADERRLALANDTMHACLAKPSVRENFQRYAATGKFPWEPAP